MKTTRGSDLNSRNNNFKQYPWELEQDSEAKNSAAAAEAEEVPVRLQFGIWVCLDLEIGYNLI
jgi:hypothetical protein